MHPRGLSQQEASQRLRVHGYNEISKAGTRTILKIILSVLREPMVLLLVCCALLYFLMGELKDGALPRFLGLHRGRHHTLPRVEVGESG